MMKKKMPCARKTASIPAIMGWILPFRWNAAEISPMMLPASIEARRLRIGLQCLSESSVKVAAPIRKLPSIARSVMRKMAVLIKIPILNGAKTLAWLTIARRRLIRIIPDSVKKACSEKYAEQAGGVLD